MYIGIRESKLSGSLYTQKPDDFRHPAFQLAESEVSSENATEWLVLAIFRIEVTTDLLSV